MIENEKFVNVIVALLFAISFTLIGWSAPVLYATNAPQSEFIEVDEFSAQNASTNASYHYLCFDRNVHQSTSGTAYTELYLINDNDERVEVAGETMERYFQEGDSEVITRMDLPPNLRPGTYRYLLVIDMDLADGRIERSFIFNSEPFTIGPDEDSAPTRSEFHCNE